MSEGSKTGTAPSIDAVSGLVEDLRAACVGHPAAAIAWPHRILHRAADALEAQARELAEARARAEKAEAVLAFAWKQIGRFPGSVYDKLMSRIERIIKGRNYDYQDPDLATAEARITALESDAQEKDEANAVLVKAVRAVTDATGSYLPPDGISKDELINRVLEATDNPKINSVMMGGRNGTP